VGGIFYRLFAAEQIAYRGLAAERTDVQGSLLRVKTCSPCKIIFWAFMVKVQTVAAEIDMLRRVYAAFNRREIDAVLAVMHSSVDWPNGMEGGRVLGTAAVRDYWKRQFGVIDPRVEPQNFTTEADGRIAVDVHQVVHDKAGKLLVDQIVQHVYEIRDGLIQSMEIRESH
jgi:ketosteroid isomerase-like protein